jgi:hypothetical protein
MAAGAIQARGPSPSPKSQSYFLQPPHPATQHRPTTIMTFQSDLAEHGYNEDPDNDDDPDLQPYDNITARASEKLTELHGYFNDWDEFVETPDPALLPTATICVKRPSGETRLMDCRPYVTTVLDVKTFMLERGGHPILLQMLVHGGKVLEDNKSLCECEITKDHTIHLHLLCGSGPRPSSPTAGSAPQAKKRHLETNLEESGGAGERAEKRLKAGVDYRGFPIPRVSYIDTTQIEHRCTLEND